MGLTVIPTPSSAVLRTTSPSKRPSNSVACGRHLVITLPARKFFVVIEPRCMEWGYFQTVVWIQVSSRSLLILLGSDVILALVLLKDSRSVKKRKKFCMHQNIVEESSPMVKLNKSGAGRSQWPENNACRHITLWEGMFQFGESGMPR